MYNQQTIKYCEYNFRRKSFQHGNQEIHSIVGPVNKVLYPRMRIPSQPLAWDFEYVSQFISKTPITN